MNQSQNAQPPSIYIMIAALTTLAVILAGQLLPRAGFAWLRPVAVLLLALAAVFMFGPFILLRQHGAAGEGQTYMQARVVVDRGLYALSRHPQYLGYILLGWGFALLSQHWLSLLLAVVATLFFYLQALQEERYCLAQFGEPYRHYLRRVPRFNILLGLLRLARDNQRGAR